MDDADSMDKDQQVKTMGDVSSDADIMDKQARTMDDASSDADLMEKDQHGQTIDDAYSDTDLMDKFCEIIHQEPIALVGEPICRGGMDKVVPDVGGTGSGMEVQKTTQGCNVQDLDADGTGKEVPEAPHGHRDGQPMMVIAQVEKQQEHIMDDAFVDAELMDKQEQNRQVGEPVDRVCTDKVDPAVGGYVSGTEYPEKPNSPRMDAPIGVPAVVSEAKENDAYTDGNVINEGPPDLIVHGTETKSPDAVERAIVDVIVYDTETKPTDGEEIPLIDVVEKDVLKEIHSLSEVSMDVDVTNKVVPLVGVDGSGIKYPESGSYPLMDGTKGQAEGSEALEGDPADAVGNVEDKVGPKVPVDTIHLEDKSLTGGDVNHDVFSTPLTQRIH